MKNDKKRYFILKKYSDFVLYKDGDKEVKLPKNVFLVYDDVEEGDVWELKYNKKNGRYDYFSNLFDPNYYKEEFLEGVVYKGKIFRIANNFYLVRVDKYKYGLIYKNEMDSNSKVGDEIEFIITYSKKGKQNLSCYKVNEEKYINLIEKLNQSSKKLIIHSVEEISGKKNEEINGKIIEIDEIELKGWSYLVEDIENNLKFKLFISSKIDTYYNQRNYEIIDNLRIGNEKVERYFNCKIINKKIRYGVYSIQMDKEFEERIQIEDDEFFAKMKKNESDINDLTYYIEREDIGLAKFNINSFSLIELSLLDTLHDDWVCLELAKDKKENRNRIQLKRVMNPEEEIENFYISKIIKTFSNKIVYQLSLQNKKNVLNNRLFIEASDIDYLESAVEVGKVFERLRYKYQVGGIFYFYTRLPYLENPLVKIFDGKFSGDTIIGRVYEITNNDIQVILENEYKIIIPKEKLKKLTKFNIIDYYEKDKLYEFYIDNVLIEMNEVSLTGYNPSKIGKIMQRIEKGDILECTVEKTYHGLVGVYEKDNEYIEVKVPNEEISYLSTELSFEKNKKYQFRVLEKEKNILILSRKRLSPNIRYELEENYPVGSEIEGIYFTEDDEGFYFNLTNQGYSLNLGDLIGYLPYNKISLYPNVEDLKNQFLNNSYKKYRIDSYPKNMNSLNLKDRAIQLKMPDEHLTIEKILDVINFEKFVLDVKNMTNKKLIKMDENKLYFESIVKNQKIIFSIKKDEFLFEEVSKENYLLKLKEYYLHLKENKDLNDIYNDLYSIFADNYNKIYVSLKRIELLNNTIEVSLKQKIKNILVQKKYPKIENSKNIYLLDDKKLNIKLKFDSNMSDSNYSYYIFGFEEDLCILKINIFNKDMIGNEIEVIVKEKISETKYKCQIYEAQILVTADSKLYLGEKIYCKINEVTEEKVIGELKIYENKDEIIKNSCYNLQKYLEKNVQEISVETLQEYIVKKDKYYKKIPLFNKYYSMILSGNKKGKYIFDKEEFSNGAFGKIYAGYNLITDEKVILKRYSADKEIEEYESFYHEARLLNEMNLEVLMKVYEYDKDEYIGEYIEGKTFKKYLEEDHTAKEKLEKLVEISDALDLIHSEGIYHLDIKPDNIMIEENGNIKLIDFGCSQSKYEEYGKYGTLLYSSPKQCLAYKENEKVKYSEKDDIYSFGIMMYQCFVGKVPYGNELGEEGIIVGHRKGRIVTENVEYKYQSPVEVNKEVNLNLSEIIDKCLELDENDRYENIWDIKEELERIIEEI